MNSNSMKATKIQVRELTELAVICALMVAGKEALSFIPNVHPVALLILVAVVQYGWKALYPTIGFVIIEIAIYGLGLWTIIYIYIWPLFVILAMPFRKDDNKLSWAILAGIYGLCFGALCSIPYILTSGIKVAISFWISGIPFDLIHGVSNFVIIYTLLPVINKALKRIR